ncbi:hypothetical protein [Catenuloplanes japonicus]|uniref:hypothetical protein n=1 Tax=Catenuloplanes japonicus TaxID=33876 RepID=UPI00068E0435|nr:hypothetical protein [Catenuloplanes japonicus]
MLPTVAGILVDLAWWLDTRGDGTIAPPLAAAILEDIGADLQRLSPAQRARLIEALTALAGAEEHDGRRHQLLVFPAAMGLVETTPPGRTRC